MSTALFISLYIGIAFALYFLCVYFEIVDVSQNNESSTILGCVFWPVTICLVGMVIVTVIIIGVPFGIIWLCFKGVKILAEKAKGSK